MADEVIKQRDMYSKTFDEGRGKFRTEMFCTPVHYEKDDGSWDDIDVRVKNLEQWEFTNGVTDNIFKAYFGDKTDSENNHLFGIEYFKDSQSKWINFKLKDSTTQLSETYGDDGNRFKFFNCFENIDVEYIVTPNSLKENIILNQKTDRRKFEFTIKSGGVKIIKDGNFKVVDFDDEFIIWNIDNPYMIDNEGKISYAVTYNLSIDENGLEQFSVILDDEDFLANASYPIYVDPSVVVDPANPVQSYIGAFFNGSTWNYSPADIGGKYATQTGALYFPGIDHYKTDVQTKGSDTVKLISAQVGVYVVLAGAASSDSVSSNIVKKVTNSFGSGVAPNGVRTSGTSVTTLTLPRLYTGWTSINIKDHLDQDFYGLQFFYGSFQNSWTIAGPNYSDITKRPRATITWYYKPSILFHDGNPEVNGYYSDGVGEIFKYLQFDPMIAGQVSIAKRVYCRNYSGFDVENLQVYINEEEIVDGMHVRLSETNNPFIEEENLFLDGIISDGEDKEFYVRIATDDDAQSGGDFNIYAKASPVF